MIIKSVVLATTLLAAGANSYAAPANFVGAASTFSVSEKTQVPGGELKPGSYSIHVVDQLADRMIVRVDSGATTDHAIFLGVPHANLGEGNSPGPLNWKTGPNGAPALRGFEFASGSTVEFVYPKNEAVDLAKRNAAKVVAVDPESEGKPAMKNMSQDDMQVISLWMLSLTTASPNDKTPAILAAKYQGESTSSGAVVARNASPSASNQQQTQVARLERPQVPEGTDTAPVAPVMHQRVIAKLPHTASQMPLVALFGSFLLLVGGGMRTTRYLSRTGAQR